MEAPLNIPGLSGVTVSNTHAYAGSQQDFTRTLATSCRLPIAQRQWLRAVPCTFHINTNRDSRDGDTDA